MTDSLERGLALVSLLNYSCNSPVMGDGGEGLGQTREGRSLRGRGLGRFGEGSSASAIPRSWPRRGRKTSPLPFIPHRTPSVYRVCSLGRVSSLQNVENFPGGLVGQEPQNTRAGN